MIALFTAALVFLGSDPSPSAIDLIDVGLTCRAALHGEQKVPSTLLDLRGYHQLIDQLVEIGATRVVLLTEPTLIEATSAASEEMAHYLKLYGPGVEIYFYSKKYDENFSQFFYQKGGVKFTRPVMTPAY